MPERDAPDLPETAGPAPRPRRLLRRYGFLAAALLLAGLVCGLHHLLLLERHGADYRPLGGACMLTWDETSYYAPMVAEKLRGRWLSANPHFWEGKDRLHLPAWLVPASLVALLGLASGLATPELFVLTDFLFPPLCVWAFYRLLRQAGAGRAYAATAGAGIVLANDFLVRSQLGWRYFSPPTVAEGAHPLDPIFFARTFSPQVVLPVMLLFLFLLGRLLRKRSRGAAAACGAAAGVLFYTYFYYWSAMLVIGGLLLAWALLRRDWQLGRLVLFAAGVMAAVGAWFWSLVWRLHGTEIWTVSTLKGGLGRPYAPEWWFLAVSVLVAGWWVWARGRHPLTPVWAAVLLAGGFLAAGPALDLPLVQPGHWRLQLFKFFLLLAASAALWHSGRGRWRRRPRILRLALALVLLLAAGLGAHRQILFARRLGGAYSLAPYREVLALLRRQPADGVVLTETEELNLILTSYTPHYVFVHTVAVAPVPAREQLERCWAARGLLGRGAADYPLLDLATGARDPRLLEIFAARGEAKSPAEVRAILQRYRLDFLVLAESTPRTPLARTVFPRRLGRAGRFVVYARPAADGDE